MILHESLVEQIYGGSVDGVNELTMVFGAHARGRLSMYNQKLPEGVAWNWNGDGIPEGSDINEENPTEFVDKNGEVVPDWSKTAIASGCYSVGVLANRGSDALRRADINYTKADKTAAMVIDNNSEFFVMPIRAGGGTFNDNKIFMFFMSRLYDTEYIQDSYTFENSAGAIGYTLGVAYQAAIDREEDKESSQNEIFKMAVATVAEYPDQNFVIPTGE